MPYEFFISLRYLRGKRKQIFISIIAFLSILGIALGVMALIVVISVMSGFSEDLKSKILGATSHIVLQQFGQEINDYEQLGKKIRKFKGVAGVTPFILRQIILTSETNSVGAGVVLRAIDPHTVNDVINLKEIMKEGSPEDLHGEFFQSPDSCNIILGKDLGRNLGAYCGDTITMISPVGSLGTNTPLGLIPKMKKFKVVGIFDAGLYEYNSALAYISIPAAQNFFNISRQVSGMEIKVDDAFQAGKIAENIRQGLGSNYLTMDWMQMNKNLLSALSLEKRVMFIILSILVLVAAFGIVSTLIMMVMEKNKDIAILKSMGTPSRGIMKIFIFEGLIIGFLGALLGSLSGLAISFNLNKIESFIEKLFGIQIMPADVYLISELPSRVDSMDVLIILGVTLVIIFIASLYPAWQAAKLNPIEALRYE